jgi:uncharacterized membrane protein
MELATIINILTYILMLISAWTFLLSVGLIKLMYVAHKVHCNIRKSDIYQFIIAISILIISSIMIFIYPGLLWKLTSSAAILEICSIPVLYHLSEILIKNWNRIKHKQHKYA